MNKIRTALGLFSSMVSGGEHHSDVSRKAFDEALDEFESLKAVFEAAEEWVTMPVGLSITDIEAIDTKLISAVTSAKRVMEG